MLWGGVGLSGRPRAVSSRLDRCRSGQGGGTMPFHAQLLRRSALVCGAGMLAFVLNAVPGTAAAAASAPTFKVVPAPDPDPEVAGTTDVGFTAVSAASATEALAVGPNPTQAAVQGPFADHWNGTAWTGMQLPTPSGTTASLLGVA